MRRRLLLLPVALGTATALVLGAAPAHAAPIVARDDILVTAQGRARAVDVLANDEGEDLRVESLDRPAHGSVELGDDGVVTYRPDDGFVGSDEFSYRARDDQGEVSRRASVSVRVTEAVTVGTVGPWTVLRAAGISGSGPPGASVAVRVTGPQTVRTLAATVADDGSWGVSFTPAWEGEHDVVVTVTDPDNGDQARTSAVAKARYTWSRGGPPTRAALGRSYRAGCPVPPSSLRHLTVTYWDWEGRARVGRLVVHARAVTDLRHVFRVAFRTRFPFRSVATVDRFYRGGGSPAQSDLRSMKADNTSAYNCRKVTGNRHRRSPHSYGTSIDINPRENPYVTARRVYPRGARRFLDRSDVRKGMLVRSSPVVRAFARRGWHWGAHWGHPDYQHFDM